LKNPGKTAVVCASRSFKRNAVLIVVGIGVLCALAIGGFYHYIVSGGLRARQTPPALESFVAQGLVDLSIPTEAKGLRNPLNESVDGGDIAERINANSECV